VPKTASAAGPLPATAPSLFSDPGTLAQRLVDAYLAVRNETERRATPLSAEAASIIGPLPVSRPFATLFGMRRR